MDAAPATEFSVALLAELVELGVQHLVVCPGSRSQALALAAAEIERDGRATLHVRIDERSAAFLALGLAAESGRPAVVITTSGTAVANLHPAVLEAHHSGVPLILVTGDRPPEMRGIGSNQTTIQHGIFGAAVRFTRDVDAPSREHVLPDGARTLAREAHSAATGGPDAAGSVHLNIAFREPLSGGPIVLPPAGSASADPSPEATAAPAGTEAPTAHTLGTSRQNGAAPQIPTDSDGVAPPLLLSRSEQGAADAAGMAGADAPLRRVALLRAEPHTVVIAGHGAGEQAERVARELGAPLLAEASSGARFGPHLVPAYGELLRDPEFGGRVARAVVFGHPTLTREVPALITRSDVHTVVVRGPSPEDYNPGHAVAEFVDSVEVEGPPDPDRSWVGRWVHTSRSILESLDDTPVVDAPDARDGTVTAEFQRQTLAALRAPVTRRSLVTAVWRATWPHDRLVVGASRLVRELDRAATGRRIRVHANRGLAGIDGTVATAVGVALASQHDAEVPGITRALIGDLTLLHDAGGLLIGEGEPQPRIQIIVGNDGGGSIFDSLEVAATTPAEPFDRVLYTPHSVDLGALASAYGWEHVRATTRSELDAALTGSVGPVIVEVPLAR